MGISLARGAWLALLLSAGCARDTLANGLEPDESPSDAGEQDAEPVQPGEDAGGPEGDSGASCSADRDGDGVCDPQDNCPDVANPQQNASACAMPPRDCQLELPGSSISFSLGTELEDVKINGTSAAREIIKVEPGGALSIEMQAACLWGVGGFAPLTVSSGVEGANRGRCAAVECPLLTTPLAAKGPLVVSFAAPTAPGGYYIVSSPTTSLPGSCDEDLDNPKRVAAICVQ